jgi:hypothetical protein
MNRKQKRQEEVLMTIQVTPNEVIAMNHVLGAFLRSQEGEPPSKEHPEVVALVKRFYYRIGGSVMEREYESV